MGERTFLDMCFFGKKGKERLFHGKKGNREREVVSVCWIITKSKREKRHCVVAIFKMNVSPKQSPQNPSCTHTQLVRAGAPKMTMMGTAIVII